MMPDDNEADLIGALPLARAALAEITPEATIGEPIGHIVEGEGVVSLLFESRLPGYPGWHWAVTVGRAAEDSAPTVLEAELLPGEGSLLAPEWVPWSERLAEYQAAQDALAVEAAAAEAGLADDALAGVQFADDEFADDDIHDIHDLHGDDDLDGVDIDGVDLDDHSIHVIDDDDDSDDDRGTMAVADEERD